MVGKENLTPITGADREDDGELVRRPKTNRAAAEATTRSVARPLGGIGRLWRRDVTASISFPLIVPDQIVLRRGTGAERIVLKVSDPELVAVVIRNRARTGHLGRWFPAFGVALGFGHGWLLGDMAACGHGLTLLAIRGGHRLVAGMSRADHLGDVAAES